MEDDGWMDGWEGWKVGKNRGGCGRGRGLSEGVEEEEGGELTRVCLPVSTQLLVGT